MKRYIYAAIILLGAGLGSALFRSWLLPNPVGKSFDHEYKDRASGPELWSPGDSPEKLRDDDWFEDVTLASGVDHTYRNGREGGHYYILESVGGGVAMVDYDGDGDLDLFFPGGGTITSDRQAKNHIRGLSDRLFRNEGNFQFTNVSGECLTYSTASYSHGCSVCDFDSDGDPDIFVSCFGTSRLLRNDKGKFVDASAALGVVVKGWATASAWGDFDNDGHLDLFVSRYLNWTPKLAQQCIHMGTQRDICGPEKFAAAGDVVFRNVNGKFENVSKKWLAGQRAGKGLGLVVADLNNDGRPNVYVANDETPNQLYTFNDEQQKFVDSGQRVGVARSENGADQGGMGVDADDINGDGFADIWVVNFEREDNCLYAGSRIGLFRDVAPRLSLADPSRRYVGFGTASADFDSDGNMDIVVANGHVFYHGRHSTFAQPTQLFRGGKQFTDVSLNGGTYFRQRHPARGLAVGDLDNDGALDLVIVHQNKPATILRNRRKPASFVRLTISGDGVGGHVAVEHDGRKVTRYVKCGSGYLSSSDARILLPFVPQRVIMHWPGGKQTLHKMQKGVHEYVIQARSASE